MNYDQALKKLKEIGQEHLLCYWDTLSSIEKATLLFDVERIDTTAYWQQRRSLSEPIHPPMDHLEPLQDYAKIGDAQDFANGKKCIAEGLVGCLMVAGGQGSRLRYDGPKGSIPITPVKRKTLFQLFAEKTIAASEQAGRELPLTIMTSPLNSELTQEYFREHRRFGLSENQLSFFSQSVLPYLNENGNLFLEEREQIAEGPDGNGTALFHFVEQGIWDRWHAAGVKYVNYIFVDNPLGDPFDAELVGSHVRQSVDVTVKCTLRRHDHEKVGVLAKNRGKVCVVEYTELPDSEKSARRADGSLKYSCANISLFCFSMQFLRRLYDEKLYNKMPLHRAFKSARYLSEQGNSQKSDKPMAWKFEKYIFDVLPFSNKVAALLYPREMCFAPLKNASGENSIEEVQQMLQHEAQRVYSAVSGTKAPERSFELSQQFYYPTPELIQRWKGKPLPDLPYIIP